VVSYDRWVSDVIHKSSASEEGAASDEVIDNSSAVDAVVKKVPETVAPKRNARADGGLLHRVHLDPATGFGIFVPGLFVMALGGAMTWHWIFNIGSGIMLGGMTWVVAAIMLTALQQWSERKRSTGQAVSAS